MAAPNLILASGSAVRATILKNAGVPFTVVKTQTDEDAIKKDGLQKGHALIDIALDLAHAKAAAVECDEDTYVLGADQILEFEGRPYDKPKSRSEAKQRFLEFSGKPHHLINASVIMHRGKRIWHHVETPQLIMRNFSEREIDLYMEQSPDDILKSVGGYMVEDRGIRLFEKINGDYFAVLGLALSPLLKALRDYEIIEF